MTDSITITGNITEPELRTMPNGDAVLSFRIGAPHRVFDRAQQKWVEKSTSWYSVSAFRGLAQHAFASLHRGDRVVVHGRLRLKEWENASGVHGFAAEIDADSLGHDLLFGTTTFAKDESRSAGAVAESWAPAEATPDTGESSRAATDGRDRELALAGAQSGGADQPF
ncbi:single-stranded DNA-binding protein [Microbacterium mangrovi]|uniref:single-stranded DNA-binding protein n=1 Tax=Microbacterium mangrovi TaxID=1348253 RepID=UPI00068986FD|nr:single-stranded DNA-binding protein [Microbacterium mangrovi]